MNIFVEIPRNVNPKVIHLDIDSKTTSKSDINKATAILGHDTEFDKTSKAVYDDLLGCCLHTR